MFRVKLRELRENAGYKSQQSFADAFGVAQSTVAGWESGKREPNYETTIRIARFFRVSLDYLLGHEDTEKRPTPRDGDRPNYSDEAMKLAAAYDSLDEHGQKVIQVVADAEQARCADTEPDGTSNKLYIAARDGSREEVEINGEIKFSEKNAGLVE